MDAISTSVSGLNAAQLRLQASANNIANANTPGYQAQQVAATPRVSGGVEVDLLNSTNTPAVPSGDGPNGDTISQPGSRSLAIGDSTSDNNVDVDQELVNAQVASYDYKANLRVIKTDDDMQQSLLNITA